MFPDILITCKTRHKADKEIGRTKPEARAATGKRMAAGKNGKKKCKKTKMNKCKNVRM